MNSMLRRLRATALPAVAAAGLLGLAAVPAFATDIHFIVAEYSSKTGPFFQEVASDYEKLHPDIHVKIEVVPWNNLLQRLTTDIAANSAPDMSIIGTRWLNDFSSQSVVEPLDGYMTPADKAVFIDALSAPSTIGGKLMGLPVAASARAMMVNLDLYKQAGVEPPKSWDDLMADAKKISAIPGVFAVGMQGKEIETDAYFYYALWTFGGDIFTKDGKSGLDSPAAIKAATFYKDLVDHKLTQPEPTNYNREEVFNLFKQGKVATIFTFPMLIPQIKAEAPNLHYAVLPFPVETTKATYGVTDTLVLFSSSKVKKETFDFMMFTYQDKYRSKFDHGEGFLPVTKAVAAEKFYTTDPDISAFASGLAYAKFAPTVPNWEEMADVTVRALQSIYLGQAQPDAAMHDAAKQVNAILAR
jgi:multiple sugar transport system substrate-binding protein